MLTGQPKPIRMRASIFERMEPAELTGPMRQSHTSEAGPDRCRLSGFQRARGDLNFGTTAYCTPAADRCPAFMQPGVAASQQCPLTRRNGPDEDDEI